MAQRPRQPWRFAHAPKTRQTPPHLPALQGSRPPVHLRKLRVRYGAARGPKHDFTADFLYGIDLTKAQRQRWRGIYTPYSYTARNTPTTTDPIAPNTADACDIAVTDSAIYELGNPRCSSFPGRGTGGEIRRLVNRKFRPADD
jgi:hypothetical protein